MLLDAAREFGVKKYVQVSTDEVYGSLGSSGYFTEETPLHPNSPYSASKAGADLLVQAYQHTFGLPAVITRCSNNYGPYQFPEKLIPLFVTNLMRDEPVPVYGDGQQVRDWIHVLDHCRGVEAAWRKGKSGEVYNFGGRCEKANIDLTTVAPAALGQVRDADQIRCGPARPRPPLCHRLHQGRSANSAGSRKCHSRRDWPRPSPGIGRTRPGSPRSGTRTT